MLSRWVVTVWVAWVGLIGLSSALMAGQVWNPNPILPLGLPILMLVGGVGLVIAATARLIREPRRSRALAGLLVGLAPAWFFTGHVLMALRPGFDRHVRPGFASKVLVPLARPFMDLEARWFYPERTRGEWVTMVGAPAADAHAQAAAMDRHVATLLARLHQKATWPITWYRGSLFGLGGHALFDLCMGAEVGQFAPGADGLNYLDRHEVAHCVITSNYTTASDPPTVLAEGWAQANSGMPPAEVAQTAWQDHQRGRSFTLRQLVAEDWYWYSGPAAYDQGAPLVNYLLRVYGPERFLKLFTTCQQATFEADCRATLGVGLDELDAAFWKDVERIITGDVPPSRSWLKNLKLRPGIDRAAWNEFVDDYHTASQRLLAPYEQSRLTIVASDPSDAARGETDHRSQRHTLIRSGPFASLRIQTVHNAEAILANPVRSINAQRNTTGPAASGWRIDSFPKATAAQVYDLTRARIDRRTEPLYTEVHLGAILLRYPGYLRELGEPTDLEVAEFAPSTRDGHRFVTIRLVSGVTPGPTSGRSETIHLAVDDDYAFQWDEETDSDGTFRSEAHYDREDGKTLLRSVEMTNRKPDGTVIGTPRIEVEERRFGPSPAAEFDPDRFLASLPGAVVRKVEEAPSTATALDWYCVAFVLGGLSLAGGGIMGAIGRRQDQRMVMAG